MQPILVEVEYGLAEYKAIVQEFLPQAMKSKRQVDRRLPWNKPWVERLALAVVLPPVFWFKKLRVGRCSFEFTQDGFRRTSKGRTASRSWSQVATVHRLSSAYLIELSEGGAMPVPYRVFTTAERATLESLLPLRVSTSDA
jgi:YcxB-like protein